MKVSLNFKNEKLKFYYFLAPIQSLHKHLFSSFVIIKTTLNILKRFEVEKRVEIYFQGQEKRFN